jgi:peptidyl-prolyl cis-trans isomerase SurA
MSRHMIFSRSLHFPVIFIFGATLAVPVVFLRTPAAFAQTLEQPATSSKPAAPAPAGDVVEDIVARVNDQIITQSDYQRSVQQLEAESKEQGLAPGQIQDRKQDLLRDLIDQQLLLSKGKDLGITGENELVRRLDEIRKQNHLDSMEDLEKAAQAQGVSYEDFKANIRNGIITQQVVQDEVSRHIALTQADVLNYYKAHQSEFSQPESVRLNEILIPTAANADAAQVSAAQANAEAVEAKLKGGAKFEDVAKASSSGPTAASGGELGEFRRGMLAPVLEEKTFSLSAGQFTEPIRTKQGFVILQVAHHTAGGEAGFKDVQQQVEETVFMQHMQPALREYLTKLREAAYIDLKPGYTDSGASPNEMHPVYSAYEPPSAKKKKKFIRARFRGRTPHPATTTPQATQTIAKAPAATATSTAASASQVAKNNTPSVQKPGKREKIRYGQAPRESLPAGQGNTQVATATTTPSQTTGATNSDVRDLSPGSSIGAEAPDTPSGKTRLSSRPTVHKTKQQKEAEAAADQPPAASDQEQADQKVQAAPLGLADQTAAKKKKEKEKGEKTRYAATKKAPAAPEQQPYMGPQQPTSTTPPASGAQPQATGDQPIPKSPDGSPQ